MPNENIKVSKMQLTVLLFIAGYTIASVLGFFSMKSQVAVLGSQVTDARADIARIEDYLQNANQPRIE